MIVLRTAAAKLVADACAAEPKRDPPALATQAAVQHATQAPPAAPSNVQPPALYTQAQAEQGKQIFATQCVACHGANLQGAAGPSVAGNDFLVAAQHNGWTLEIMRYVVFDQMPRNTPASLSPTDDADVMAYLLASNCYPAGTKPFPSADSPSFAKIKLGPVPGQHPDRNAKGVCDVH
jgi:mono/diheme cytochrome c family protein